MITLYRVTNPGDTISNVSADNKLQFNTSPDTKVANAFITDYDILETEAIGSNQSPQQDTGDIQDLGRIEQAYVLKGFISKRNDLAGFNQIVVKMQVWESEAKTNANFRQGRFGIQIDDFRPYDVVPFGTGTAQKGLIWESLKWRLNFQHKHLIAPFEWKFVVSRGDGT
jgi:hypothetical protein